MSTGAVSRILLVEDDPSIALGLVDALEFEGFRVTHAKSGRTGIERATAEKPDCILLDLMLPDMNGYQVCSDIRRGNARVPIIMLTARSQEADKIRGLDAGADDYVTKPFGVGELVARLRAAFRRMDVRPAAQTFEIGDMVVNLSSHTVEGRGKRESLSVYEVELLRFLHERRGHAVSRDEILDRVWGQESNPTNRTIDNFIVKLRRKIEPRPDAPEYIVTVYGLGYKLAV